jgi:ATPase family associated with various cellular activities (AAA)
VANVACVGGGLTVAQNGETGGAAGRPSEAGSHPPVGHVDVDPSRERDPSVRYLVERLDLLADRITAFVGARRRNDRRPDDPFRGLYLADADVQRLLASRSGLPPVDDAVERSAVEQRADEAEAAGHDVRLRRLARTFDLTPVAVEMLLVAVAPDVDRRFEGLYGYLHDDVTRRRATPWLALEVAGCSPLDPSGRGLLQHPGALVAGGLVVVEEVDRPFLTRSLRVPDRVCRHLLGDDSADQTLDRLTADIPPYLVGDVERLAISLSSHSRMCYLRDAGGAAAGWAHAAFRRLGAGSVLLDLDQLPPGEAVAPLFRTALLEAKLTGRGLVAGPVDVLADRAVADVWALTEVRWPLVMYGRRSWDPAWSRETPLVVDVPAVEPTARTELWRAALGAGARCTPGLDPGAATATFRLAPDAIGRAATSAWLHASYERRPVSAEDLRGGARSQNAAGLERLAHRISPSVGLSALVLPAEPLELVQELVARARRRAVVLDRWNLRQTGRRGDGISGLFVGPPGTGKTLAAEAVAGELGLDLYTVELATVVDKYIGETEKNLDRIFGEAERVNGVLFFDEADALFGKRSEVKDARDRYANVEVAYLLQRMEAFDGLAILATNLRVNLDEAFTRRLDLLVEFILPDEADRLRLWRRCFGTLVPLADDVDLDFCAKAFEMAGGDIRNVTLTAAYLAADAERAVTMADVVRAIQREYRKLGRLCVESEFGPYWPLVAPSGQDLTGGRDA